MSNNREKNEPRIFGGLAVIRQGGQFLIIKDTPKVEVAPVSSELAWWPLNQDISSDRLGLPGGGRGQNPHELPETLRQTLRSEIKEEISTKIQLPKPQAKFKQQIYPATFAQLKPNVRIDQFGVTSLLIDIDNFNKRSQRRIHESVDQGRAFWINFLLVNEILSSTSPVEAEVNGLKFRPQTLFTGYIWYLDLFSNMDKRTLSSIIQNQNKRVIGFVQTESAVHQIPVRNGAFSPDGTTKADLSRRDQNFLFGSRRSQ